MCAFQDRSILFEPELLTIIETHLHSRTQVFPVTRSSAWRDAIDQFLRMIRCSGADGERITVGTLQARIGRLFQTCGGPDQTRALPYLLRHTYATVLTPDTGIKLRTLLDTNPPRPRNATSRRRAGESGRGRPQSAIRPAGQTVIQSRSCAATADTSARTRRSAEVHGRPSWMPSGRGSRG